MYAKNVIENAQALSKVMLERGLDVITGGTDCHLLLVDLTPFGITGAEAAEKLERAGLTCNKNSIPFDSLPPVQTSGIRLGSPAGTTRGFGTGEFQEIGHWIADVLRGNQEKEREIRQKVEALCQRFPIYGR
jgi:glycine hydroxymethyltransferase